MRYTKAFCHVGLLLIISENCWPLAKNAQQMGASQAIIRTPDRISQAPATIQRGKIVIQLQTPKKQATEIQIEIFHVLT